MEPRPTKASQAPFRPEELPARQELKTRIGPDRNASKTLDDRPSPSVPPVPSGVNTAWATLGVQHKLAWYGRQTSLTIGPYTLADPLTYVAQKKPLIDEASCIDLSLPIGKPITALTGSLGYYPRYQGLWPAQRAKYLAWLASGRTAPLDDIGFAFLFFYGLERRLLLEHEDLSPIVKEVVRLLETYTKSRSFDGYLSRFLGYVLAREGIGTLKEKWFQAVFERTRAQKDEQHLAVGLAWLSTWERPLPASWALRIARLDPRAPRSVVVNRLPEPFAELFKKRYQERFGNGMTLKVAKREAEITYRPASPTCFAEAGYPDALKPVRIPNVMGIQSQFQPLIELWTGCIEELKPLSRMVAKGIEISTRQAYEALPEELRSGVEHPDEAHWDRLASENAQEDGTVLVEVGHLARIQGWEQRAKLTAKQSESLARTADHIGFLIEPDVRITNRPYAWEELVALVRPEESPQLPSDTRYAGASVMLELGMFVAAADGTVEEEEVDHIARFLESQFLLEPTDARRLEALKHVLISRKPSLTGVGKRLQAVLTPEQRQLIGRFLVGVAAANGEIDRAEATALRAAYKTLGVNVGHLNQLLDEFRRASSEPVEIIRPSSVSSTGELIPSPPEPESGFKLDPHILAAILHDTNKVMALIGQAMGEFDPPSEKLEGPATATLPDPSVQVAVPPPASTSSAEPARFRGLDPRYQTLVVDLLAQPVWSSTAFEALIRQHGHMVSGAVDQINEWAEDTLGDLLIEEQSDHLSINSHLITG